MTANINTNDLYDFDKNFLQSIFGKYNKPKKYTIRQLVNHVISRMKFSKYGGVGTKYIVPNRMTPYFGNGNVTRDVIESCIKAYVIRSTDLKTFLDKYVTLSEDMQHGIQTNITELTIVIDN